jgi:hypothetical protein
MPSSCRTATALLNRNCDSGRLFLYVNKFLRILIRRGFAATERPPLTPAPCPLVLAGAWPLTDLANRTTGSTDFTFPIFGNRGPYLHGKQAGDGVCFVFILNYLFEEV